MKVLHIFPEFKRGGAQINVLRFIKATPHLTHYVAAACLNEQLQNEYVPHVKEIVSIDMTHLSLKSLRLLIASIKKIQPDIVHVNGKGAALYAYLSSFFTGKPYKQFHTMRGFHIKYSGLKLRAYLKFERLAANKNDGTILVSPSEKELLNRMIPGLDQSKLFLIPNGIDIEEISLEPDKQALLDSYSKNIVTLSRLSPQKDLKTMILAFNQLKKDYSDPQALALHIMGGETPQDREYANEIKDLINHSPYKRDIYLWGAVKKAGSLIKYFDIYWSTALFEGLPTAVVEAGLCRTLIVGTNCVGNCDLIFDQKTGIVTEIESVSSSAEGLKKALDLLESQQEGPFIEEAHTLCQSFSIERNSQALIELYNS